MMISTETVPILKYKDIPPQWVLDVFGRPEPKNREIQDIVTKLPKKHHAEDWSYPSLQSKLWKSYLSALHEESMIQVLPQIYLSLLQCQYLDPVEDTGCISPWITQESNGKLAGLTVSLPFRKYMDRMTEKGVVPLELLGTARNVWERLQTAFDGKLPEPDVASNANHSLMLAFDDGKNHLEFEIVKEGCAEVFFLKRDTDDTWEMEFIVDSSLPDTLLDKVRPFLK